MARNLIVSGGVGHPFEATSACLVDLIAAEDIDSEITSDVNGAFESLGAAGERFDLVTINALRWQMGAERYAAGRPEWSLALSDGARRGLCRFLGGGGGLFGVHTASICFDDWPEWGEILGGTWNWDRSSHPPVGPAKIRVVDAADELVAGIDDFDTVDEIYGFLELQPNIEPLLSSCHGGVEHPVLWRREVGPARVVYDALGHDGRAYDNPAHRCVVRRAARWAAGGTG